MSIAFLVVWLVIAAIWHFTGTVRRSVAAEAARTDDLHDKRPARRMPAGTTRPLRPVLDESQMVWTALDDRQLERLLRDSAS